MFLTTQFINPFGCDQNVWNAQAANAVICSSGGRGADVA